MLDVTHELPQPTNSTYKIAMQYAPAAVKSVCLLTACYVAYNCFGSGMPSPFAGYSLPTLDNHGFSLQHNLTNVPAIQDIANPFMPNITPTNFSSHQSPVYFTQEQLAKGIENSCELAMNSLNAAFELSKHVGNHLYNSIDTFVYSSPMKLAVVTAVLLRAHTCPESWLNKRFKAPEYLISKDTI